MSTAPTSTPWRVTFHDSQTFADEFDRNLVKGGLFVPTDIMLRGRAVVDFVLVVPYSQEEILGKGEVIYVIDQREASRRGIRAGVGLHLLEFDMDMAKEARRVIGEVMTQAALQPPEQRQDVRIQARLKVQYQGGSWNEVALTRDISKGGLGFHSSDAKTGYEIMKDKVSKEMERAFNPEFLNRVDDTIVFHSLTKDEIGQIIHIVMKDVRGRLEEEGITLRFTDAALEFLVDEGYDEKFGARPLKRAIQRYLEDPLSEKILQAEFSEGDEIEVDINPDDKGLILRAESATKT